MKQWFVAMVAALLMSGAALADHHMAGEDDTMAKSDPNEKICKMVKVPGNRTKTKVCQKQSFWDEQLEIEKRVAAGGPVDP